MSSETKETRYDEAIALKEAGNRAEAIQKLEAICADFPEYALPHSALSMLYSREGEFAPSLAHAAKVCELEPQDPFSFTAMSILARQSGDKDAAESALAQAQTAQMDFFRAQMEKRKAETEEAAKIAETQKAAADEKTAEG